MFITYPTNIDYLLPEVRLHIGDFGEQKRFSDSVVRTALVSGIKMLQRRWANRYIVYYQSMTPAWLPANVIEEITYDSMVADNLDTSQYTVIVPTGYVYVTMLDTFTLLPTTYKDNDVFRNPYAVFDDTSSLVIAQEDEYPVILSASITLRKSLFSSSADSFQSWSDGQFSYSNLGSQRALGDLYNSDMKILDEYFKKRLSGPLTSRFSSLT